MNAADPIQYQAFPVNFVRFPYFGVRNHEWLCVWAQKRMGQITSPDMCRSHCVSVFVNMGFLH